jgi:hypothetical protein
LILPHPAWRANGRSRLTAPGRRRSPTCSGTATAGSSQRRRGRVPSRTAIEFLKSYDIVVHPRCRHTIDELTLYSWKVDDKTGEVLPVLEDKKNHVIDALRYAVEALRRNSYGMLEVI